MYRKKPKNQKLSISSSSLLLSLPLLEAHNQVCRVLTDFMLANLNATRVLEAIVDILVTSRFWVKQLRLPDTLVTPPEQNGDMLWFPSVVGFFKLRHLETSHEHMTSTICCFHIASHHIALHLVLPPKRGATHCHPAWTPKETWWTDFSRKSYDLRHRHPDVFSDKSSWVRWWEIVNFPWSFERLWPRANVKSSLDGGFCFVLSSVAPGSCCHGAPEPHGIPELLSVEFSNVLLQQGKKETIACECVLIKNSDLKWNHCHLTPNG